VAATEFPDEDPGRDGCVDGPTIVVTGPLDASTASELALRLRATIPFGRGRHVVLDLSGVTSLTAAGLDLLLGAQRRLEEAGGRLVLRDPTAALIRLLYDGVVGPQRALGL
jgi:anti-anti-sigma factor